MLFILVKDGVPVGEPIYDFQIKSGLKNVSFPKITQAEHFVPFGYEQVFEQEKPPFDERLYSLEEAPIKKVDGAWCKDWVLIPLFSQEELTQKEMHLKSIDEEEELVKLKSNIRSHRNGILRDCDWTQVADASVDQAAWATYRQALRDVPQQAGFPYSVVWPVKP